MLCNVCISAKTKAWVQTLKYYFAVTMVAMNLNL